MNNKSLKTTIVNYAESDNVFVRLSVAVAMVVIGALYTARWVAVPLAVVTVGKLFELLIDKVVIPIIIALFDVKNPVYAATTSEDLFTSIAIHFAYGVAAVIVFGVLTGITVGCYETGVEVSKKMFKRKQPSHQRDGDDEDYDV